MFSVSVIVTGTNVRCHAGNGGLEDERKRQGQTPSSGSIPEMTSRRRKVIVIARFGREPGQERVILGPDGDLLPRHPSLAWNLRLFLVCLV